MEIGDDNFRAKMASGNEGTALGYLGLIFC